MNDLVPAGEADVLDDADRIPLSIFFEHQSKLDAVREFMLQQWRDSTKLICYHVDSGVSVAYAITMFGIYPMFLYTASNDQVQGLAWTTWLYGPAATPIIPSLGAGLYPECVLVSQTFATEAAVKTYFEKATRQYYPYGTDKAQFFRFFAWGVTSPDYLSGTCDQIIEKHASVALRAMEVNRIDISTPLSSSKYFNAHKYLNDALVEQQAYDSWSELSWPELPGIRTAYIDNIGVFIPDYCEIDFNLSHSLGKDFVACYPIRPPSSHEEMDKFNVDSTRRWLEYLLGSGSQQGAQAGGAGGGGAAMGGGIAQAIIGGYNFGMGEGTQLGNQLRLVYPRVRAFGRQHGDIMDYATYVYRVKTILGADGWTTPGAVSGGNPEYKLWNSKYVSLIAQDTYEQFSDSLTEYVRSRGG